MTTPTARWSASRPDRSSEGGYVAVMTGLLLLVLMGIAALAVDVGFWYVVGQKEQRAADAAALAGVTSLPGDTVGAFATAQQFSTINGFTNGALATTVTPGLDGRPTRLRVTVTRTVDNFFGPLLGVPKTTISRTAVADYAGPVPLGSPCNEFGDDPVANGHRSTNCNGTGAFWANIGSPTGTKISGDAYQDNVCASGDDGCSGSINTDFDPNGYTYTITVTKPVSNLQIQAFDPAQIVVGDHCNANSDAAKLTAAASLPLSSVVVPDPGVRYVPNDGPWCTGDTTINGTNGLVKTQFTVHDPGANAWEPMNWPIHSGCQTTFDPFNGNLAAALDKTNGAFRTDVAANFRQWVNLCSISGTVPAGTYAVQVKTNGLGSDGEGGHNRFGLRAFGSGAGDNDVISVAGFNKMAVYANTPSGTTRFYLAKVPSGAKGQLFNVRLFDVGDGAVSGSTITVVPPTETGGSFSGCTGSGPTIGSGPLASCTIKVDSTYNGKWETISVPIPPTYACNDVSPTGCWVRLEFNYGSGSTPNDTTSWTASIEGDPVRLVE